MVQEFVVLRCYSCQTFQVHQVKKLPKWTCKVCGEKQSRKKVYGQGKAIDCRKHVQKLNLMRGHIEDNKQILAGDDDDDGDADHYHLSTSGAGGVEDFAIGQQDLVSGDDCCSSMRSKWSKFMTTNSSDLEQLEGTESGGFQVTTERAQFDKTTCKRKRTERHGTKNCPEKGLNPGGKAVKRQFLEFQQKREDIYVSPTDPNKSQSLPEQGRNKDNQNDSGGGRQTSLNLSRPGVNTISSTVSIRDEALFKHSKWSKFLVSSSEESTQPVDNASSSECSQDVCISSHSSYSCSNAKEILTSNTQVTSVFSIDDDLEEDWWEN